MKVLVCGSRHFKDYTKLKEVLSAYPITEIVEGEARGADLLGRRYGEEHGLVVHPFPAEWDKYGKRAGMVRNSRMLKEGRPDMVIAFRFNNSKGTQNMIDQSVKAGLPVKVVDCTEE